MLMLRWRDWLMDRSLKIFDHMKEQTRLPSSS